MFPESDLLPLSALQHLLFCPRQCALIHVERLWAENSLTLEGRHLHVKADRGAAESRGRGKRAAAARHAGPGGAVRVTRALPLRSFQLGLSGKADVVEFYSSKREGTEARRHEGGSDGATQRRSDEGEEPCGSQISDHGINGNAPLATRNPQLATPNPSAPREPQSRPYPVEYKRGKPKRDGSDAVQLCAQALCLEEMLGVPVPAGALYYGKLRRRVEVVFDDALRTLTRHTIARLREMVETRSTPPAVREKKCDRCSLRFLCLPDVTTGTKSANGYLKRSLGQVMAAGAASH